MNIISSLSPTKIAKNLAKLLTNASKVGWPDPSFVVDWVWLCETRSYTDGWLTVDPSSNASIIL